MKQSILLTTVNETKHRLDMRYYDYPDENGSLFCTAGIQQAEAGIRLMLSRHHIDRILVLGPPCCGSGISGGEILSGIPVSSPADISAMSEYDFLCYRIRQYMEGTDIELQDICGNIAPEARERVKEAVEAFRVKYAEPVRPEELFAAICRDRNLEARFEEALAETCSGEEVTWAGYYLFSRMDEGSRMHILEENRNVSVSFVPVDTDGVLSPEAMTEIVRQVLSAGEDDIDLYVDAQGLGVTDGSILISTVTLLNRRIGYRLNLCGLIETERRPGRFCGRVRDVLKGYNIAMLISGIEQFLDYGRNTRLREYWNTLGIQEEEADRLFAGMDLVDEGISLCRVDLISGGLDVIRREIAQNGSETGKGSIYLNMIRNAIRADYGNLLEGESLCLPELLGWSLRKGFYQQTLTLIEALVPGDMTERGIYYYAETETDIEEMMRVFNELYWTRETRRSRYIFADPERYYIKNYLKDQASVGRNRDEVAEIYGRIRAEQIHTAEAGVLRAYSQLEDDALLRRVLSGYYAACNARNRINHAEVSPGSVKAQNLPAKSYREELHAVLEDFLENYGEACRRVKKVREPLRIDGQEFARYLRSHRVTVSDKEADHGDSILS